MRETLIGVDGHPFKSIELQSLLSDGLSFDNFCKNVTKFRKICDLNFRYKFVVFESEFDHFLQLGES